MDWKGGYKNRKESQHSRGSRQDAICDGREQVRLAANEIRGDESCSADEFGRGVPTETT